jgi:DNA-directed RNA polymerase subunit alpha
MEKIRLSDAVKVQVVSETANTGVFEIAGLYSGYGTTLGNALRRVLFSSIAGAAITKVKIKGVGHEFTTIEGVMEDVVEIMLNLKRIRFAFDVDYETYEQPEVLTLKAKGEGAVTAANIENSGLVRVINKDAHIATITQKGVEFEMELTIEKGLGYVPAEASKSEALPVGVIQLDAIFSPVTKVNFTVENMRVGERTDFNKLRLVIDTDGSVAPSVVFTKAVSILQEHFAKVSEQLSGVVVTAAPAESEEEGETKKKKASKKKDK